MGENQIPSLDRATLWRVAARSLFLEASWNLIGQQNLGFAAAVNPALKVLYKAGSEEFVAAQRRVLSFFNTNPVLSGLVIGAALKLEEERAKGLISERDSSLIVSTLASTLAIHGDLLFWQAWLPFSCLMGFGLTWLSLAQGQITFWPLIIPALFGALAWPTRIGGIFYGYRLGATAHRAVAKLKAPLIARVVLRLTVFLTGFLTVYSVKLIGPKTDGRIWPIFVIAALAPLLALAQKRWPKIGYAGLYLLIVFGLTLAAVALYERSLF
ncbi:MAG: PTS system mannose/fructose/sorbose family transporter subunit IID [Deltaproteobacteria bacterium]|jgi:PTS system mannose-specific IID component|nr:PTS system mannose/fructose/sorbose family transporter subunit IID [Deltaproteobacteria bacterium]